MGSTNVKKMDLNQLRIFSVIAKEGTLARAASLLCLSQPAVSAQLKALEESFHLKLFDRTSRGMLLTHAGHAILEEATRALAAASNVAAMARQFVSQGVSGTFRLGTIVNPKMLRLSDLIALLVEQHPHVQLSFSQGISGDIMDLIGNRELNAGYVIGQPADERITAMRIAPITLRVVAPPSWRERIANATWNDIVQFPWLSTPERCSFRSISARMFARHHVTPRIVIEADQETMLSDLVSQGIGLTLLREDVASDGEAAGKVCIWEPGIELEHLYFAYLNNQEKSAIMQAVVPLVRQVWSLEVP